MDWVQYQKKLKSKEIPIRRHGHRAGILRPEEIAMSVMLTTAALEEEISFPVVIKARSYQACFICGKAFSLTCYEDRVEAEDTHEEQEPFSVEVEFPSGDMLFNDTYPLDYFEEPGGNINTIPGIAQVGRDMARQGLLHFFVGNSCPAVWREGDTIFFGRLPEEEWDDPKRIGAICTDLWWASFVDSETLRRRGATPRHARHMREKGGSVQVQPGTYRCTSYYHLGNLDYGRDERQVYGKLELVS